MKFDLQVNNRTFEIRITFCCDDGCLFDVYEHIPKKHWYSCSKKYLFKSVCAIDENIKKEAIGCINGYLKKEKIHNDFIKQIEELSK